MSTLDWSLQQVTLTTAQIAASSAVPKVGQLVWNSQTGQYKIGDGSTALSALTYYGGAVTSGVTIGTTTITSGTNTRILYNNNGVVGEYLVTGTGTTAVLSTSPQLTTPNIGVATGTSLIVGGGTNVGFDLASISSASTVIGAKTTLTTGFSQLALLADNASRSTGLFHSGNGYVPSGLFLENSTWFYCFSKSILIANHLSNGTIVFSSGSSLTEGMRIDGNNNVSISGLATTKVTSPTAYLHLAKAIGGATVSSASLKFTSATALLTTPEVGAIEFLTDSYYATITTGAARKTFAFLESPTFTGTVTIPTPFTLGAVSVTSTGTQLNYLASATGTTGTASTNLVFSTSPSFATSITMTGGTIAGSGIVIRPYTASDDYAAIYMGVTPGSTNYVLVSNGSGTFLNSGASGVHMRFGGTTAWSLTSATNISTIDTVNMQFGTTTGTKLGTATTQKISFWNATPIVQPTTAVAASTLTSNGGTTLTSTDTIDGYTLLQVVKALRNTGLLA